MIRLVPAAVAVVGVAAYATHRLLSDVGSNGFSRTTTTNEVLDRFADNVRNKTFLITGSATPNGIGFQLAVDLASHGGRILVHGRTEEKALKGVASIRAIVPTANLKAVFVDLENISEVVKFARNLTKDEPAIDVVVINAGVVARTKTPQLTVDGFEKTIATNLLSQHALVKVLLPSLIAHAKATNRQCRVVQVSSLVHTLGNGRLIDDNDFVKGGNFDPIVNYGESKIAQIALANEMDRRYHKDGVTFVSLHPGLINTNISGEDAVSEGLVYNFQLATMKKTLAQGAATSAYCAVAPEVDNFGGRYFSNCHVQPRLGFDICFGIGVPFLAANRLLESANRSRIIQTYERVEQLVQPFLQRQ